MIPTKLRRLIAFPLLVAGLGLFVLNGYGLAAPQDPPDNVPEIKVPAGDEDLVSNDLSRRDGESEEAYFERLTMSLHYRIAHHWPVGPVPLRENYVLNALKYFVPSYHNYEYINHEKAIERGYGICTQYSLALFDVLEAEGFDRRIVQLVAHTFVEATTSSGEKFILDSDYGVVMPYSWDEIDADPSIVRPYYEELDPELRPNPQMSREEIADFLEDAFDGDVLSIQVDSPTPQTATVEPIAYGLKWTLPAILIGLGWWLAGIGRRRNAPADTPTATD